MTTQAKQARLDRVNEQCKRARDAHFERVDWALAAGFTPREAPFAAEAVIVMKVARKGREVKASEVRERIEREYPSLFEPVGAQA